MQAGLDMVDSASHGVMQDAVKPAIAAGVAMAATTGGKQLLSVAEADNRSSSSSYSSTSLICRFYSAQHWFTVPLATSASGIATIL